MAAAIASLQRAHPSAESRLLANLIKAERAYIQHLAAAVGASQVAASALSAWGTSEPADIADAAARLAALLSQAAEMQQTHVAAIDGYRSALKDVADREHSLRSVVRDRDILVGRLIKASKQSSSSKRSPEERAERVAHAQRELTACEEVLAQEEAALVGVKRRTFKEALTMRCKTMGDAGAAMVDAARDAILLLNDFDASNAAPHHAAAHGRTDSATSWSYGAGDEDGECRGMGDLLQRLTRATDSRHNHPAFENNSVTPSQSASQVYRPAQHGVGSYSNHFTDIGEGEDGDAAPRAADEQSDDSDEEDWRRMHEDTEAHQGGGARLAALPPPHRLAADAGTAGAPFLPHAANGAPQNGSSQSLGGHGARTPPAPAPPSKDPSPTAPKQQQQKQKRPQREVNHVPMPAVPSAPRLNLDGTNLGDVPKAPRPYVRGGDDSSSDEATPTRAHRGGSSTWGSRPGRNASGDASSDEGRTAKAPSRPGAKRSGSFFGRMSKLFRTDVSGEPLPKSPSSQQTKERQRPSWETRTPATPKADSGVSRRQSLLRPLPGARAAAPADDSSDEEDPANLVRHVNPGRPLWQSSTPSAASDRGGSASKASKRMGLLRRHSVTVGPQSQKARAEEEARMAAARASVIGAGLGGTPSASATNVSGEPVKRKKKKKSKPTDTGSEIGTAPTRTAASNRTSDFIVPGAVGSGIGRSDSMTPSVRRGAAGALSRSDSTATAMSTKTAKSKKRSSVLPASSPMATASASLGAMSPKDASGKYTTSTWVARNPDEQQSSRPASVAKTAAEVAAQAGVVPKSAGVPTSAGPTLAAPTARRAADVPKDEQGSHVPQPSRTMSPPLKPALKAASIGRSGSISSATSNSARPVMPPVATAPPLASSLLQSATANATAQREASTAAPRLPEIGEQQAQTPRASRSVLSIEEDKRFDGSGSLGFGDTTPPAGASAATTPSKARADVPHIEMPKSEPFRVELDPQGRPSNLRRGSATPSLGEVFMTPGEVEAYDSFLRSAPPEPEPAPRPTGPTRAPGVHDGQPTGVTRMTVERKRLMPSRTYSGGIGPQDDSSSDETSAPAKPAAPAAAAPAAAPAAPASNTSLSAPAAPAASDVSFDGSGVGRRKSVRMAPDVKLPPETPQPQPEMHEYLPRSQSATAPAPALSSRIAPPPPAPPRLPTKAADYAPVDIGRERSTWTSRIGTAADDSSDEEVDDYASARRAFGSASRHLGKATGAIKAKVTKSDDAPAASPAKKSKKKKTGEQVNHGYNAAVPLPAGMQVVGRSPSAKRK
jgi:hypothetical protein